MVCGVWCVVCGVYLLWVVSVCLSGVFSLCVRVCVQVVCLCVRMCDVCVWVRVQMVCVMCACGCVCKWGAGRSVGRAVEVYYVLHVSCYNLTHFDNFWRRV